MIVACVRTVPYENEGVRVCASENVRKDFVSQNVFFKSHVTVRCPSFKSWLRVRVGEVATHEFKSPPPIQLAANTHTAY